MFKRIIAFILLFVFMCFKCITWIPSAAATGIPAFDAFYYAILQTLGMAYTNGVELDLAPAIAEVRQAVPDYLQQPDVALKYLLRDYAGRAWDYLANNWNSSNFDEQNPYLQNTAAIGLANSSGMAVPTLQDIVTQWGAKALDNDKDITTPINTNTVSYFNKFSNLFINEYLNRINYNPDQIKTYAPAEYLTKVDKVVNFYYISSNVQYNLLTMPLYTGNNTYAVWNNRLDFSYIKSQNNQYFCAIDKVNFILNGSDDNWTLNISSAISPHYNDVFGYKPSYSPNVEYYSSIKPIISNNILSLDYASNVISSNNTNFPLTFNSIDNALNWINSNYYCCNLTVNDSLWGYSGEVIENNFNASIPDAVIDNSTDDGKIVSHPIYWVINNNTGTPIDSQINLDKLIDYLKGIIDGTNSDTDTSFADLVDAGVIEDIDGNTITDSDVITVPISEVIDDALARDDPIAIPEAITGPVPPLPPLPPFFPTPDFPEGDPTSGFNGMSVLARIINITNQSLPGELVVVFYGVIFGAVVLGLIKILHK